MNVSLTPHLRKLVTKKVASGRYGSASEVVREALRLFEERERLRETQLAELRREVLVGVRALDRGDSVAFDRKTAEAIKAEGRRRLTSRTKRD
jgi:antitoxin ParD1/3/4